MSDSFLFVFFEFLSMTFLPSFRQTREYMTIWTVGMKKNKKNKNREIVDNIAVIFLSVILRIVHQSPIHIHVFKCYYYYYYD